MAFVRRYRVSLVLLVLLAIVVVLVIGRLRDQQARAVPRVNREIRTPALWGLRFRRPLLHDGSAVTIEDAIRRHGGEAERSRRLFDGLDEPARQSLLAFLLSL